MNNTIPLALTLLTMSLSATVMTSTVSAVNTAGNSGFSLNAGDPRLIAEEGAWCWFADPRAIRHQNEEGTIDKTYVGYIDVHGNIKGSQFDNLTGQREDVLVRSCFQPDDHDNPTFLILPDDRVMIFYSRHTDEPCFYYRVSREAGDITTLGEEKILKTANNTTYPSPFILSGDPEHIYLCWRGINWHPTIAALTLPDKDDNVTIEWGPCQMVQSTGARPYAKYLSDGKDRIMMAYTTGHPDNELPNYLYFNYIDIDGKQLLDVGGNVVANIGNGPLVINKDEEYLSTIPEVPVDMPEDERDWLWQIAADDDGNPMIATVRINPDKDSHAYYLSRRTGKGWENRYIADAGRHFHQSPGLEKCYSAGMAIDPDSTNIVYCSLPRDGRFGKKYEIIRYEYNDKGEITDSIAVTKDSEYNNVRPYVIGNSAGTPLRVTWMKGDYFDWIVSKDHRLAYNTSIMGDGAGEYRYAEDPGRRIMPGENHRYRKGEDFTIETVMRVPEDGKRIMLNLGDLIYRLDTESGKPEIRLNGKTYRSTNVLGTSDSWRTQGRGTNGKWYAPAVPESFILKMTYKDGVLSTYINGYLDQKIQE